MTLVELPWVRRALLTSARRHLRALITFVIASLASAGFEGVAYPTLLAALTMFASPTSQHAGRVSQLIRRFDLSPPAALALAFAVVVAAQAARAASSHIAQIAAFRVSRGFEIELRERVAQAVASTSFQTLQRFALGQLTRHVIELPREASNYFNALANQLISAVLLIVYVGLMVAVTPFFALLAVVIYGATLLGARSLIQRLRRESMNAASAQARITGNLLESLNVLRLVFSFGAEEKLARDMTESARELSKVAERRAIVGAATEPTLETLLVVALGALVLSVVLLSGRPGPELLTALIVFVALFHRAGSRLQSLVARTNQMSTSSVNLAQLASFVDRLAKAPKPGGSIQKRRVEREILLSGVSLVHPGRDKHPAVNDLRLSIPAGKTTALVGTSGSGKSTVLDLLLGLLTPSAGSLQVDDVPFADLDLESWRRSIGIVGQETFLLNTSVRANISFGTEGVTDEAIVEAATLSGAMEFIERLPNQLDEVIGERGATLSGGQRQRLALARALVRKPEVLLLDEATSTLDGEMEQAVTRSIRSVSVGRTVVMATHRLRIAAAADQIVVLHQGRCVEMGTHRQLLATGGLYARLYGLEAYTEGDDLGGDAAPADRKPSGENVTGSTAAEAAPESEAVS